MPARWRRGAIGVLTAQLGFDEFLGERVLVTVDLNTAAGTTWTCRTCDQTVYGPPLNTHCNILDGPAVVRISSHPG